MRERFKIARRQSDERRTKGYERPHESERGTEFHQNAKRRRTFRALISRGRKRVLDERDVVVCVEEFEERRKRGIP